MRGGLMDDAFTWSLWETFKKRKQSLPKPLETSCQENIWQTCTKEYVDIFELLNALSSQLWATFKAQVNVFTQVRTVRQVQQQKRFPRQKDFFGDLKKPSVYVLF